MSQMSVLRYQRSDLSSLLDRRQNFTDVLGLVISDNFMWLMTPFQILLIARFHNAQAWNAQ